jgi:dolichol kinase
MKNLLVLSLTYLIAISLLLVFNELIYRRLNPTGEITRKFAHFISVLATVPFPYIFPSHWYILVLALLFTGVLFFTRNGTKLKSIHDVERKSIGSYLLPLSIYVTFLISNFLENMFIFILPMLILAISDPMAAILGINLKTYNGRIKLFGKKLNKTWLGSGAFLISSFLISIIALYFHNGVFDVKTLGLATFIAVITMIAELISGRGADNLSIPLSAVLILILFL